MVQIKRRPLWHGVEGEGEEGRGTQPQPEARGGPEVWEAQICQVGPAAVSFRHTQPACSIPPTLPHSGLGLLICMIIVYSTYSRLISLTLSWRPPCRLPTAITQSLLENPVWQQEPLSLHWARPEAPGLPALGAALSHREWEVVHQYPHFFPLR